MMKHLIWSFIFLIVGCQGTTADPTVQSTSEPTAGVTASTVEPTSPSTEIAVAAATESAETPTSTLTVAPPTATPTSQPTAEPTAIPTATEAAPTATPKTPETSSAAPRIVDFSSSQWIVNGQELVTISWEVTNATQVTLYLQTPDGPNLLYVGTPIDSFELDGTDGRYPLPPLQGNNNEYVLIAENGDQQTEHSIRITYDPDLVSQPTATPIAAANAPTIVDFSSSNWISNGREIITLSWNAVDATNVYLYRERIDDRALIFGGWPSDSFNITGLQDHFPIPPLFGQNNKYTLVAVNGDLETEQTISITYDPDYVTPAAPTPTAAPSSSVIQRFGFSQDTFLIEDTFEMFWETTGAERIQIVIHTSDIVPYTIVQTGEASGVRTLNYNSLPTYMFESYGVSSLHFELRAYDANGSVTTQNAILNFARPTAIKSATVQPNAIAAGDSLSLNYNIAWASHVAVVVVLPEGERLVFDKLYQEGRPAPPASVGENLTLTWDMLTGSGAWAFNDGSITLKIYAGGYENGDERTFVIPIE